MATAPYLDLMAFARGAELGTAQNWRDVQNDVAMRANEARLAREEAEFGLQFPLAQQGAELASARGREQMQALQDNQAVAKFTAATLQQMTGQEPSQRAATVAQSLRDFSARATPGQLGALMQFGQAQAFQEARARNLPGALQILGSLPGVNAGPAMQEVAKWNDPAQFMNPDVIAQAGGVIQPDGRVKYGDALLERSEFARLKGVEAVKGALANIPQLISPLAARQGQVQRRVDYAESMRADNEALGYKILIDTDTGNFVRIPMAQVQAGAYPETAGGRYPAPAAPTVGATTPTGAQVGVGAAGPVRLQMPPQPQPQPQQSAAPAAAAQPDWMRWLPGARFAPPLAVLPPAAGSDPYDWLTQPNAGGAM